jgi:hypothetical protein
MKLILLNLDGGLLKFYTFDCWDLWKILNLSTSNPDQRGCFRGEGDEIP